MFKLLGSRVGLRVLDDKAKTDGGIILPDSSKPRNQGEVVAVGADVDDIKVGDTVLFETAYITGDKVARVGEGFEIDGQKVKVMESYHVIGII